jgi:hypothetical protein
MLHGLLLDSYHLPMQIFTPIDEIIHLGYRIGLAQFPIAILDGRTPIYIVFGLQLVVLMNQSIDAMVDATLRYDDVVALLQGICLLPLDHIVILLEIGPNCLLEALADTALRGLFEVIL